MTFTVHEKNPPPETGFNDEPVSSHDDEQEALDEAADLCQNPEGASNTILVQEEGTNRTWTAQHMRGEVTVGYTEGVPYLVPASDEHVLITYDSRENAEESEEPEGDFEVTVLELTGDDTPDEENDE